MTNKPIKSFFHDFNGFWHESSVGKSKQCALLLHYSSFSPQLVHNYLTKNTASGHTVIWLYCITQYEVGNMVERNRSLVPVKIFVDLAGCNHCNIIHVYIHKEMKMFN